MPYEEVRKIKGRVSDKFSFPLDRGGGTGGGELLTLLELVNFALCADSSS